MSFASVLVHVAVPWQVTEGGGTWVEGEWVPSAPTAGTPFSCVLFLPQAGLEDVAGAGAFLGRRVIQPTLLYEAYREDGTPVALAAEDELDVIAPEINRAQGRAEGAAVRWQLLGEPQPFGKPGADVLGFQATLSRVAE